MSRIYLAMETEKEAWVAEIIDTVNILSVLKKYPDLVAATGYKTKKEAIERVELVRTKFLGLDK